MAVRKKQQDFGRIPQQVLVLDADASLVKLITGYLRDLGCSSIAGFTTGDDVSAAISAEAFDLFILDWRLKHPPAIDIYRKIRAHPNHATTPIILISGFVTKDDIWVMKEDVQARFLVKPFTEEILNELVTKTFGAPEPPIQPPAAGKRQPTTISADEVHHSGHNIMIAKGAPRATGHDIRVVKHDQRLGPNNEVFSEQQHDGRFSVQTESTAAQIGEPSAAIGSPPPKGSFTIREVMRDQTGADDERVAFDVSSASEVTQAKSKSRRSAPHSAQPAESAFSEQQLATPQTVKPPSEKPPAPTREGGFFTSALVDKIAEFFGLNEPDAPTTSSNSAMPVQSANSHIDGLLAELITESPDINYTQPSTRARTPAVTATVDAATMLANSRPLLTKAYLVGDELKVFVPERALIVDPDESHRKIVENYLQEIGVRDLQSRHHGDEAWELLSKEHFDLVIIDWRIKRVSGLALYNRLRQQENHAEIPVIVLAGFVDREDFRILTESHCTKFLEKPFQIEVFDAKLKETCRDASIQSRIQEFVVRLLDHAKDDPQKVLDVTSRILEKVPNPFQFLINAGRWLLREGRHDAAESVLEVALRLDPRSVSAMTELGKVWHARNSPEKALPLIEKALQFSPQNIERLCLLGDVGLTIKDTFLARQYFKDALSIDPNEKHAHAGLLLADNIDQRLVEFDQRPVYLQFASALNIVGITLARNGQIDKAAEQYKAAMCFIQDNAALSRLRFNLGLAHLRAQELDQAELWFNRAREIAPADFKKPVTYHRKIADLLHNGKHQRLLRDGALLTILEGEEDLIA